MDGLSGAVTEEQKYGFYELQERSAKAGRGNDGASPGTGRSVYGELPQDGGNWKRGRGCISVGICLLLHGRILPLPK